MDIKVSNTSSGTFLIEAFDTSSSIGNLGTADTIIANNSVAASFSRSTINLSDGAQGRFSERNGFRRIDHDICQGDSFSVDTAGTFTIFLALMMVIASKLMERRYCLITGTMRPKSFLRLSPWPLVPTT